MEGLHGHATYLCVRQMGFAQLLLSLGMMTKGFIGDQECKAIMGHTEIATGRGRTWFLAAS